MTGVNGTKPGRNMEKMEPPHFAVPRAVHAALGLSFANDFVVDQCVVFDASGRET